MSASERPKGGGQGSNSRAVALEGLGICPGQPGDGVGGGHEGFSSIQQAGIVQGCPSLEAGALQMPRPSMRVGAMEWRLWTGSLVHSR